MDNIQRMTKYQRYEVLDLWLRCLMFENELIESNFWQKNYDKVKNDYLVGSDNFVHMINGKIAGFICVTNENFIKGLFVAPLFRGNGIGERLLRYIKEQYSMLHVNIYIKNRSMITFATHMGFVIDGAFMNRETGEIRYSMIWNENE